MAGARVRFACSCGSFQGRLVNVTASCADQLQCHCDDCRRAVVWLGQPDPGPDGIRYFQTTPDCFELIAGADQLHAIRWKSPRLIRWYAACCNTPLFNTLDTPKWAFASLMVDRLATPDALGPCTAHAFVPRPNGKRGHKNAARFMWGFAKSVTVARITGTWRDTPFFNANGTPVAPIQTLTHEDRAQAKI